MTIRQNIRNAFFCETSATIYAEIERRKAAKKACDIPAIAALEELLAEVIEEERVLSRIRNNAIGT